MNRVVVFGCDGNVIFVEGNVEGSGALLCELGRVFNPSNPPEAQFHIQEKLKRLKVMDCDYKHLVYVGVVPQTQKRRRVAESG